MTIKELKKEINQLKTNVKRGKERLEVAREIIRKISTIETRTTGKHKNDGEMLAKWLESELY